MRSSHRPALYARSVRRFLTLRWFGLHAAMVVTFAGFLALGWWQFHRAEGGNALSWGYTFEWPLFAGFVVVFWVKMMRDELREARERAAAALGAGAGPGAGLEADAGTAAEPLTLPAGARTRRQGGTGADGAQGPDDEPDEELDAYNAYLARLNAEAGQGAGGLSARRHAAAARTGPEPPAGDVEV